MSRIIDAADLFCGGGGTSSGLYMAADRLGFNLNLTVVNHWEKAIETLITNHPDVKSFCTGIDELKPSKAIPGGKLDLLIASPECTHHSIARGGKPYDDQSRSSAWHVLHWCQELYVKTLVMENVPEFVSWGPLGANRKPLKSKRGQTFQAFIFSLQALGYKVDWRILTCADYGDATTRRRFFLIAKRGNKRVQWPEPSHSKIIRPDLFQNKQKSWIPARDIIDWNIPGHSIFLTKEDVKKYGLKIKRPLVENTIRRIEAGIKKYWGEWAQPFLVMLYNTNNVRSINRPLPTITTSRHIGLAEPFLVRYNGERKGQFERIHGVELPMPTIDTNPRYGLCHPFITMLKGQSSVRSISDSIPTITTNPHLYLCEPFILPQHSAGSPRSVKSPLSTICTESRGISIITPFITPTAHSGGNRVRSIDEPLSTIVGKPDHYLVDPFIIKYYGTAKTASIDIPLDSITTDDRFGLIRPMLIHIGDEKYLLDILFRMLTPKELSASHSFAPDYHFAGNKSEIIKQIGNSVPVKTAEALCMSALAA